MLTAEIDMNRENTAKDKKMNAAISSKDLQDWKLDFLRV